MWPFKSKTVQAVPGSGRGRGGWFSILEPFAGAWQRNIEVDAETVMAHYAVFSCVTLISSDIGKMRVTVKKQTESGVWLDAPKEVPAVLKKPNNFQTWQQFMEQWMLSKNSNGNTYVLKIKNNAGRIIAFRILNPRNVTPLVADDGSSAVFYQVNPEPLDGLESTDVIIPAREIIHDRFNCIYHPLVGLPPIFASGLAAMHGHSILEDSAQFFKNGGRPGGVITVPGNVGADKIKEIKATWEAGYSGANAGKTAVLADGMTYTPNNSSKAADNQVVEQLNLGAAIVASTYHVPLYKLSLPGSTPSYDNIEALEQQYYAQALQPHIEAIETLLDEAFDFTDRIGVEFDLNTLLRMDTARRYDSISKAIAGSWLSPNEGRARENLPPVPGGDSPMIQQQNYSLAALAKRDAQDNPFATSVNSASAPTTTPVDEGATVPADEDKTFTANELGAMKLMLKGMIQ